MRLLQGICEASKRYNPRKLIEHTTPVNGSRVVRLDEIIESPEDQGDFITIMHHDYRWDFSTDYNNTSVYFEPGKTGDTIIGGVYDLNSNKKLTRVTIAASISRPRSSRSVLIYIYRDEIFRKMFEKITKLS